MEVVLKVEERESVNLSSLMNGTCFILATTKKITDATGIYMRVSEMINVPCGPGTRRVDAPAEHGQVRCVAVRSGELFQFPNTEQVRVVKAKLYVFGEEK